MKAGVLKEGRLEVLEVAEPPPPSAGQLLVETIATGICGTDSSVVLDPRRFQDDVRAADAMGFVFDPSEALVLGHEFSARVIATGRDVDQFHPGDVVVALPRLTREGMMHAVGLSARAPGALAERCLVDSEWAHVVPSGLDPQVASLTEPLSLGAQAASRARMHDGDTALVFGAGVIGLGTIAALAASGTTRIAVVEPLPTRRALGERWGARLSLSPDDVATLKHWLESSPGRVVAFECAGRRGLLDDLIRTLPPGSKIVVEGIVFGPDAIHPGVAKFKGIEVDFVGVVESRSSMTGRDRNWFMEQTLGAIARGEIEAGSLISARVSLDDVPEAFRMQSSGHEHLKVLVCPALMSRSRSDSQEFSG